VERDVRQLSNIGDLAAFTQFLKLCAGRTAQEINLSALGGDAGVSHNTARAWLSVLEASYLVLRAPAWHRNLRKQLVKAPKLHFVDAGLACHLLGIRSAEELRHHPLRGALFQSWVASEIGKHRLHRGAEMSILHYRESRGVEVDILILEGSELLACEVKSAATIQAEFLSPLRTFAERMRGLSKPPRTRLRVLYGGEAGQKRKDVEVIGWREIQDKSWLAG
jgi:predicted AAA+ superfamily ATPase